MSLSMTGFGSHTAVLSIKGAEKASVYVEIKSLNSRFFEFNCKLPSSLSFLEIPISNHVKKKLIRGRAFLSIKIGGGVDAFEKVVPVVKIVEDYLAATKLLKKKLNIKGDVTISDIVMLDNVFSFEREEVGKSFEKEILKIISKVTDKLIASRKSEGGRLQDDLKKRFDLCNSYIAKIKKFFTSFMKKKKEEIKKLIDLTENGDLEAEQKLEDCYELLNKIDIHEEIIRFTSHLKGAKKVLLGKEVEKGKRLEFTLQELSREINTIAAKCSNFDISSLAVDVKVELEKAREQVQNFV